MLQDDSVTLIMTLCFAVQVIAAYVHSSMTVVTFITYVFIVIHSDTFTNIHRHE
jgi:hypothetical protein